MASDWHKELWGLVLALETWELTFGEHTNKQTNKTKQQQWKNKQEK